MASSDWFENLAGFPERDYQSTQKQLTVEGDDLISAVNKKRYSMGTLALEPLSELRARVAIPEGQRTTVQCIAADVGELHARPEFNGALFQVASQFNLLEMTGPNVTPEDGVARYASDHTQGPTCAIAAGAATIYRNYLVPVDGKPGQTRDRQVDGLAEIGAALSVELGRSVAELWTMRNGYALCRQEGLRAINALITGTDDDFRDALRAKLAIGMHRNVQVTAPNAAADQHVSQAFCSALPVSYGGGPRSSWETFARLILEAAYEATMLAAVEQSSAARSSTVLLTRLGGGVFGNDDAWIDDAIVRSLAIVEHAGLDVRLVSYGRIDACMQTIADNWNS